MNELKEILYQRLVDGPFKKANFKKKNKKKLYNKLSDYSEKELQILNDINNLLYDGSFANLDNPSEIELVIKKYNLSKGQYVDHELELLRIYEVLFDNESFIYKGVFNIILNIKYLFEFIISIIKRIPPLIITLSFNLCFITLYILNNSLANSIQLYIHNSISLSTLLFVFRELIFLTLLLLVRSYYFKNINTNNSILPYPFNIVTEKFTKVFPETSEALKKIFTNYTIYHLLNVYIIISFYDYYFNSWLSILLNLFFIAELISFSLRTFSERITFRYLSYIIVYSLLIAMIVFFFYFEHHQVMQIIPSLHTFFVSLILLICFNIYLAIFHIKRDDYSADDFLEKKENIENDHSKKIIDGIKGLFKTNKIDYNDMFEKLEKIKLENEFQKGINNSMNSFLDELRNKIQPIQTSVDQLITFRHESQNILINMDYKTGELKNKITSDTVFRIDEYVESISAYINDLKDKINESKRINSFKEPEPELLSVKELIESCMNSGEVEAMILHNNIQVYYNIEEDKDSIFIDRSHGKMCLGNIIRNSLRAIDQRIADAIFDTGDYKPHIIFSTEIANGKTIIKISDNGCGMPEHISKKLYREKISTQLGDNHGSGGMIVAYLLKLNNCSITVVDSSEAGTVQVITGPYSAEVVN